MELSGYSTLNGYDLLDWGANFNPYTFKDEWWRLLSSMFLHIGFIHLFANMFSLYNLGTNIETTFGHRAFITTYFITGLVGSLTSGYFNVYIISAGASGAIFGIYGFHIVQVIAYSWHDKQAVVKSVVNFVLYVGVITWIGTKANFDNAAHFGGLISGTIIAIIDVQLNQNRSQRVYPFIMVIGFILIMVGYIKMPRFKVQYFDMFQTFLNADNLTTTKLNSQYSSDKEMANELELLLTDLDNVQVELDSLPQLPKDLERDKELIDYYLTLRNSELNYLITGIRQESYIYMDSLDIVRKELRTNPPLNYVLNYNRPEPQEQLQDSIKQTLPFREFVTVYYDSLWRECPKSEHYFFRRGTIDSLGLWNGYVSDFFKNGNIQMKGKYTDNLRDGIFIYYNENNTYSAAGRYEKEIKIGKWQYFYESNVLQSEVRYLDWAYTINTWDSVGNQMVVSGNGEDVHKYKNGVISSFMNIIEGQMQGEAYGNHENGTPYYKEFYNKGKLEYGISYSLNGERNEYDFSTYIPHPQGGSDRFQKYIDENLIYPTLASNNNIEGYLDVLFTVYIDGTVGDFKYLNQLGHGCEEEAKRLIENGPKWIPMFIHGNEPVTSESRIRISFP